MYKGSFTISLVIFSQNNNTNIEATTQEHRVIITNNNAYTNNNTRSEEEKKELIAPAKAEVAITGFGNISLGANMESTIEHLMNNPIISLPRKYQDIDIASETSDSFISINQNKFFRSGYFLFQNDSLYAITIRYQQNQTDFLALLQTLNDKYGKGAFMNADTVAWEYGDVQMILERPTTIKYINTNIANDVRVNYTNMILTNQLDILEGI